MGDQKRIRKPAGPRELSSLFTATNEPKDNIRGQAILTFKRFSTALSADANTIAPIGSIAPARYLRLHICCVPNSLRKDTGEQPIICLNLAEK